MKIVLEVVLLVLGFVLLIKGADMFVDGASSIAGNFKISKMIIGLTIVAFGTSFPEFAVSIKSLTADNYDVILGNVIGSNILNILLILGVCSLFKNIKIKEKTVKVEIPVMILLSFVFGILLMDNLFNKNVVNSFTRIDAVIIVLIFMGFIFYLFRTSFKNKQKEDEENDYMPLSKAIIYTIIGILMIFFGSNFVVDNASFLALNVGVSERMISLTIVSLGTSLPELVTSVTASKKGEVDLAIGNVVGSNIFNIGVVIGIPVLLLGSIAKVNFNYVDLIVMLLSGVLLWIFSFTGRTINKKEGIMFLIIFCLYYGFVIING